MRGWVRALNAQFCENAGAALALFGGVSLFAANVVLIVALGDLIRGVTASSMLAVIMH
jgi:hypothetical protein